jgi:DNA gyrase subunit A
LGSRIAKGVPLPQVLPINSEEKVTSVIPIESFDREDEHLVLLTKNGFVKKTKMSNFKSVSARGLIIISLSEGDSLGWTRRCVPDEEVMIATRDGFACRFSVNDLTSTGRTSRGVRALNLRDGDQMADIDICSPVRQISEDNTDNESFVFAVTERGFGKRIPVKEFRLAKRGGRGVYAIKFKDKAGGGGSKSRAQGSESKGRYETDALCSFRYCSVGDEIVISTNKGTILRQKVDDVSVQTRAATGVLIQKIAKDDAIVMVDVIPPEIEEVLIK